MGVKSLTGAIMGKIQKGVNRPEHYSEDKNNGTAYGVCEQEESVKDYI